MAVMISVYGKRSVAPVASEEFLMALRSADMATIAESRHLWPGWIDDALARLRIVRTESEAVTRWEFWYESSSLPQCVVRCVPLPAGAHDVELEELRTLHHPGIDQIRRHLAESVERVTLEFPEDRQQFLTAILASEAARWIAEMGDGIISRADNTWWDLDPLGAYRRILP